MYPQGVAIEFYSGPEPDYSLIGASVGEPDTSELNCIYMYIYTCIVSVVCR